MILEIHSHTHYSHGKKIYFDGISSPEEMVSGAKKVGADGIFITDHDTIEGALNAKTFAKKHKINVFVGEEISTRSGHLLALGIQEVVAKGLGVEESLDKIHEQGGIGVASHPFDIKRDGMGMDCVKCDGIEIFNPMNLDRYSNKKAFRVAKGKNKPMTAGSDAHWYRMLGHGQIEVKADNLDGVLKEMRKGRIRIVKTNYIPLKLIANLAVEKLRKSYEPTVNYIENNYSWPKKQVSKYLLSWVKKDTAGMENLYKFLTVIAFGSVIVYGRFRRLVDFG